MLQHVHSELANHIFDLMEKFAGYGFNKSHSASYALIAYQTAWLKTHYPAAFMAAVLSTDMDRIEKIIILLAECQSLKLHVSPPDINKSDYFFKVIDNKNLMYGLGAIKGVGLAAIENMMSEREKNGLFKDLFDFCQRIDLRKINKRVFEALIKSGCFDSLGKHRATIMASYHFALQRAEQTLHNETYGQHDLLGMHDEARTPYIEVELWDEQTQLQGEKETLGFYLSGHPLNRYLRELVHFTTCRIVELNPHQHQAIRIAGIITTIRIRQTKRGDRLAIVTLDDGTEQIDVVCFSERFQKYRPLLNKDQLIIVEGDLSLDDFNQSSRIVSRELYTIDEARERFAKHLQISIMAENEINVQNIMQLLNQHVGGNCPIIIKYTNQQIQSRIKLGKKWLIKPTDMLFSALKDQLPLSDLEWIY